MHISDLPPELLLEVFAHLPHLRSLIAAQGVNRDWRRLLPLSDIRPARRALLELYMHAVKSPSFLATRETILPQIVPFDREEYLAKLCPAPPHSPDMLPEQFRLWILEWPTRATISRLWPGYRGTGGIRQTHYADGNLLSPPLYSTRKNFFADYTMEDFDLYMSGRPWSSPIHYAVATVLPIYLLPADGSGSRNDCLVLEVRAPGLKIPVVHSALAEQVQQELCGTVWTFDVYHGATSFAVEDEDGTKRLKERIQWVDYLRAYLDQDDARLTTQPE
ncbi:hypothetical protein PLICRDRAFT_36656 [Plicaturopsis crispa FD-325 SS-3]|nr:hypothetical protein PLICRDRAFT_36656 [Plicaturopsis crispa FD-325 SS-3]